MFRKTLCKKCQKAQFNVFAFSNQYIKKNHSNIEKESIKTYSIGDDFKTILAFKQHFSEKQASGAF